MRTGDLAYRDEDGYFFYQGRADDIIISAGYRIGPFEVESMLMEHDSVAEAAVVGSPDERRREIVKAFVKVAPKIEPSDDLKRELQDFTRKELSAHEYPREIEFVDELPKTESGKIRRVELKEREKKHKA